MTGPQRFWRFVGTPFRAVVSLTQRQVRSLFAIAMLAGIIALSAENWVIMGLAHHAVVQGDTFRIWFDLLLERSRYNSILQGFFALIMGLVVFGADYFRAKWGDNELSAGQGEAKAARKVADAADDEADKIADSVVPDKEMV